MNLVLVSLDVYLPLIHTTLLPEFMPHVYTTPTAAGDYGRMYLPKMATITPCIPRDQPKQNSRSDASEARS